MKRTSGKFLSVLLAICMLLSLTPMAFAAGADEFADVPADAWYRADVSYVAEHGYFNGTSGTTFSPADSMTRAMFVAVLSRVDGQSLSDDVSPFTDVASGAWYAGEVKWASDNGIVTGVGGGSFAPGQPVSRQQMAAFMARFIAYYAAKHKVTFKANGSTAAFADTDKIAAYAKSAVTLCRSYGLVDGNTDGTFAPEALSTRAQVAAVIHRLALLLATGTPAAPVSGGGSGTSGSSGGGTAGSTTSSQSAATAADFITAAQVQANSVTASVTPQNYLTVNDDIAITNDTASTLTLDFGAASIGALTVNAAKATTISITGATGSARSLTVYAPKATVTNSLKINGTITIKAVSGSTFNNTAAISGNILFTGPGALNDMQATPVPVVVSTREPVAVRGSTTAVKVTAEGAQVTLSPASDATAITVEGTASGVALTLTGSAPQVTLNGQVAQVTATAASASPQLTVNGAVGSVAVSGGGTLSLGGGGAVEEVTAPRRLTVSAPAISIGTVVASGAAIAAPAGTIDTVRVPANSSVDLNTVVNTVETAENAMLTLDPGAAITTVAADGSLTVGGSGAIGSISVNSAGSATVARAEQAGVTVSQVTTLGAVVTVKNLDNIPVLTKAAPPAGIIFSAPTSAGGQGIISGLTNGMAYRAVSGGFLTIVGRPGETITVSVNAGTTYEVYFPADGSKLASDTVSGTIPTAVAVSSAAIQGEPIVGRTLTAVPDSAANGTLTYQWKANGTPIETATGKTFTLTEAQIGKTVSVTIANYPDTGESAVLEGDVHVDNSALLNLIAKAAELQLGVSAKDSNITAAQVPQGIVFVTDAAQAALAGAIASAQDIADSVNTTAAQMRTAEDAMRAANDTFIKAKQVGTLNEVDSLKTALSTLAATATGMTSGVVTDKAEADDVVPGASWVLAADASKFSTAISTANTLAANGTTAAELSAGIAALNTAITDYLKAIRKGAALDRTALDAAVNAAEINAASVLTSTDGVDLLPSQTWVTSVGLANYKDAITAAMNAAASVQNDYVAALAALNGKTDVFNALKRPGTKDIVPPVVTNVSAVKNDAGNYVITFTSSESGSYSYTFNGSGTDGPIDPATKIGTITLPAFAGVYALLTLHVMDASGNTVTMAVPLGDQNSGVASITGGGNYATLSAAVSAAGSGKLITLLKDTTEDAVFNASGKTLILDLAGHKLTNAAGNTITVQSGTLTVIDSSTDKTGTVDNVSHGMAALKNEAGGTVILSGGSFTRSLENGIDKADAGGNSFYTIQNYGTMTINNGTSVTQDGHYSSLVENGYYDGTSKTGHPTLTINGGSFSGGLNTIKNDDWGVLTVNGGVFTNVTQNAIMNWNTATLKAGSFVCENGNAVWCGRLDNDMDLGRLTITGGSYVGAITTKADSGAAISIQGTSGSPTFSGDPSAYVAPGYKATYNESVWTVAKISVTSANANVQVGSDYYKTLSDAVAAATSGQTVTLLNNLDLGSTYTDYDLSGLILDLNGKTVTAPTFTHIFVGSNAEIKNGTMVCADGGSYALWLGDDGYTTSGITVSDVTTTGGVNIYNASGITLKHMNVTGTNYYAVWLDEGAFAAIESGIYSTAGTEASALLGATATTGSSPVQSVLTVTGGTFNATDTYLSTGNGKISISGGNFTGPVSHDPSASNGTLTITGGTFSSDPSTYVDAQQYTVTPGTGTWTVEKQQTT